MDAVVTIVITSIGLGMLVGPLWWLKFKSNPMVRLEIITGCILLFAILLSVVTVARPFEVLAATAA